MPFLSDAQSKFLLARKQKLPKEFASQTPKGKKLPAKVRKMRRI